MNVFFTGCTHFDHENIIRLANRPFVNVDDMNETLVENWNRTVKRYDKVFHLGDFMWRGPRTEGRGKWHARLHGDITFLQGNHDPAGWGPDIRPLTAIGRKIVLCHYPIEEWDGWWHNSLHLHCHTHSPNFATAPRRFNVTVEACHYRPVSIEEIMSHDNARPRDDAPV